MSSMLASFTCPTSGPRRVHATLTTLTRTADGRHVVSVPCPCGDVHDTDLTRFSWMARALTRAGALVDVQPAELADPARARTDTIDVDEQHLLLLLFRSRVAFTAHLERYERELTNRAPEARS